MIELTTEVSLASSAAVSDVPLLLAAVPRGNVHRTPGGELSFQVDGSFEYTVLALKLTEVTPDGVTRYTVSQGTPTPAEGKLSFQTVLR